jgi:predicted transcriptional regulator
LPVSWESDLNSREKKHRSRLEIVRDVLFVVTVRTRKTRIMYQTNLSFQLIEKYLGSLVNGGLVEFCDGSHYLITDRGKDFLQMYDDYLDRCKRINDDVGEVRKNRVVLENMCFNNNCISKKLLNQREVSV